MADVLRNLQRVEPPPGAGSAYWSSRASAGPRSGESRDRGAEVRFGCVPELGDERMPFERPLYDSALNACAAPVNQSNFAEAGRVRFCDVLVHD